MGIVLVFHPDQAVRFPNASTAWTRNCVSVPFAAPKVPDVAVVLASQFTDVE
ncbi:hypothetical protein [Leekyejoonella antrihumi]|uniref:hypothetical protein n=1 Tax=Leekyejoonella antrihumi TaxID=1660198 RepID=UPI001C973C0C|nr:hypothetical protein [Leekyejoonella antrihumi]